MSWIYIANCDLLSYPLKGPLIAFNLNTLGRKGELPAGVDGLNFLPWKLKWAGKFKVWTYQQSPRAMTRKEAELGELDNEKSADFDHPESKSSQSSAVKVQEAVYAVIKGIIDLYKGVAFQDFASQEDQGVAESSVTGVLAGLSQKGHPISAELKMSHWIEMKPAGDVTAHASMLKGQQWLFAVPILTNENGAELTIVQGERTKGTADLRPQMTVEYKDGDKVYFSLRVSAADLEMKLLQTPLMQAGGGEKPLSLDASSYTNWRREFPFSVGQLLDLNWPRLRDLKKENLTGEVKKRICQTVLSVAHDRADLGMRAPLSAYPQDWDSSKGYYVRGSLAWEVLTYLAKERQVLDAEDAVDKALDAVKTGYQEKYLDKLRETSNNEFQWEKMLQKVLKEQPGTGDKPGIESSSHSMQDGALPTVVRTSLYADLEQVLMALIPPVAGAKEVDLNGVDFDKFAEQLEMLLTDERALISLFCLQWDSLNGMAMVQKVLGTNTDSKKVMTQHREKIIAWAEAESKSLAVAYGQGLAGSLILVHSDKLKNPEPLPNQLFNENGKLKKTESDESKNTAEELLIESAETQAAGRVLNELLVKYREDRKTRKTKEYVFPFLALSSSGVANQGADELATVEMIQHFVFKGRQKESATAAKNGSILKDRAWATVLAGGDQQRKPIAKPAALMIPTPVPDVGDSPEPVSLLTLAVRSGIAGTIAEAAAGTVSVAAAALAATAPLAATVGGITAVRDVLEAPPEFFDPNQMSGWLVFGRRTEGKDAAWKDPTHWNLLNVGDMVLKNAENAVSSNSPLKGHELVPVPLGLTQRPLLNLPGSGEMVEYRARPLGVLLWEDYATWDKRMEGEEVSVKDINKDGKEVEAAAPLTNNVAMRHRQILAVDPKLDWGAVPGLRYNKDSNYQFVFCPVHATGALPPAFCFSENPATLLNKEEVSKQINQAVKRTPGALIEITNYLRRVPVGQPRLTTNADGKHKPFNMPEVSMDKVVPLATDLRLALENSYLENLYKDQNIAELDLPSPPAQTLLLQKDSEIKFFVRPPATDVDNWSIWLASIPTKEKNIDFIADVERLNRELKAELIQKEHSGGDKDELKKLREKIANLVDDPAVHTVISRRRQIFPVLKTTYEELRFYSSGVLDTDLNVNDPGYGKTFSDGARAELLDQLRKHWSMKSDIECTLTWEAPKEGAPIVYEYEFIPCVTADNWERFGLDKGTAPIEDITKASPKASLAMTSQGYAVFSGVLRLWVEHVPTPEQVKGLLPSPDAVWQALKMGRIGEFSCKSPWVERLEVALQPSDEKHIAWTMISTVELTLQKWYWRGLPEYAARELAALLDPALVKGDPPADQRRSVVEKLCQGELPSFGDRPPNDSSRHIQVVNFAAWFVHRKSQPPAVQLHAEPGEPLDVAEHVLGRLKVWNRYAGLTNYGEISVEGETTLKEDHSVNNGSSPTKDKAPLEKRRRLTLKGTLREQLPVPRVKMVVPMMVPVKEKPGSGEASRPGFLAITSETLRSPFHCLIAEVEWARLETVNKEGQVFEYTIPEIGLDPITSPIGQDWSERELSQLRESSTLVGMACGLTYERQADTPRFPHAGHLFQAPMGLMTSRVKDESNRKEVDVFDRDHDWFVKVQFRQKILPEYTMETHSWGLTSEPTGAWQVRLLAPMNPENLWDHFYQKGENVTCRLKGAGEQAYPEFFCKEKIITPSFKVPASSDKNKRAPRTAYLCTVWSLVPDAVQAEPSKAVHSLYLCYQDDNDNKVKYLTLARTLIESPKPGEGERLKPAGVNLLRIFTVKQNLEHIVSSLILLKGTTSRNNDPTYEKRLNKFMEWLYPDGYADAVKKKDRVWEDAGGIPVRYSDTIPFE